MQEKKYIINILYKIKTIFLNSLQKIGIKYLTYFGKTFDKLMVALFKLNATKFKVTLVVKSIFQNVKIIFVLIKLWYNTAFQGSIRFWMDLD